jgi:hypothetical protein
MPEYDRNGRRIPRGSSPLVSPLGGVPSLIIEKAAWSPSGLTAPQIAERLERRLDKIKELLPEILEAGLLVEASGVYRAPADLLERLELELERSGCNAAEERDRIRYENERRARRLFVRDRHRREPDGSIEDLEPLERVEASPEPESPGPTPEPVLVLQSAPLREIVQSSGKFALDALITDDNDPDQVRELAHVLRTGQTCLEAQQDLRSARRQARRLDRERGGYERRKDGARMSPASFLRSELLGVSGMGYLEMLRRWKAMGGKAETLEGAISAGPYRLKREPMDFNRPYVYPAVALAEWGAA